MRKILHAYQLRLTNLSQGNRSLKLGRLSKRRDIDWKDLDHLAGKSAQELLEILISGRDLTLISQPDPRHEPTNLVDRRLNSIYRSAQMLLEESGTYDLYLGYPFVEGKFLDGTPVRSPLLLFPVRLMRNLQGRPRWKLRRLEEPVQVNPTFFLAYETYQSWRLPDEFWEEEIDHHKDWQTWIQQLYQKIKDYELAVNFNSELFERRLQPFPNILKEGFDRFKTGVLTFRPQAVLGIFPQSDSTLLQDYETIAQNPEGFPTKQFLGEAPLPTPAPRAFKEEDRYFALPVDAAQEDALLAVKQGSSLVVHGPPGTGKSQVIVNMITDALAHGKKVLVVSQKRAALDVVYKRLDGLGLARFAMLVHDHRHDRSRIYRNLHQQIQDIEAFQAEFRDLNHTVAEHEFRRLSRDIDSQTRQLQALSDALQDRSRFGMSPHELYLASSHQKPFLDLRAPALKLTRNRLLELLEKLVAIRDYRDFLAKDYPWKHRLSFRHYQQTDKKDIRHKLALLPQQLQDLSEHWNQLHPLLEDELLDTNNNSHQIALYRRLNGYFSDPNTRRDVETLALDGQTPSATGKILRRWEKQLGKLTSCQILGEEDWRKYDDLDKHLKAWQAHQNKALRWLSVPFLRARWYLYKLLSNKGREPQPELVGQTEKEFRHFQAIRSHVGKLHNKPFFNDFPLLDRHAEKQQWLERKQQHLNAWKDIRGTKAFPAILPDLTSGIWNEDKWTHTMQTIESLHRFNDRLKDALLNWRLWLHPDQIQQILTGIANDDETIVWLESLSMIFERDFFELQSMDRLIADLDQDELKILELSESELLAAKTDEAFSTLIQNSVYLHWLEALETDHPELTAVSGRGWERQLREYRNKYHLRQPEVASLVARRLKEHILSDLEFNRLNNRVTYRDIHHQVKKKRRLWPVRKLISETWKTGLQKLAPCWLASPESAAALFPMKADLFDLVIFDEASQCFVERSIPIMLRGTQVVIAGDDMQLPPSDLYRVRYEEELDEVEHPIPLEVVSVLDLARQYLPEKRLTWHYRSESEALIAFSNQRFYEGSLQMIPPARISPLHQPALKWVAVKGKWEKNTNREEAVQVLNLIEHLAKREDQPSVGVVTFNFHQQELILDLIEQRLQDLASHSPDDYEALTNLINRVAGEEHQGLFVKNIENVQGDERDVIIFSIAYAKDASGRLQTRFGLLNQAGGENRLNVAVTRARWQIFVVCSFLPEDLNVEHSTHEGPKVLKAWLRYAWTVSHQTQIVDPELPSEDDHALSRWVRNRLETEGFLVKSGLGDSAWQLDLAVKRPGEADWLAGFECEGPAYFRGRSAKEREIYRPDLLERQHWKVWRVWARNVWLNSDKVWTQIMKVIE